MRPRSINFYIDNLYFVRPVELVNKAIRKTIFSGGVVEWIELSGFSGISAAALHVGPDRHSPAMDGCCSSIHPQWHIERIAR